MSVNIVYKKDNEEKFWQLWHKFIDNKDISPKYLRPSLLDLTDYAQNLLIDKSFIYLVNNEPQAVVFLPIEKTGGVLTITSSGNYVDAPLFSPTVEKRIFSLIDDIAKANKVAKIKFAIDPNDQPAYNYLMKYNYLDTSILNYCLDLTAEVSLDNVRRNHRRNIKLLADNKDYSVFYIDSQNPDYQIHEEYRELHHKCAGRVTREKETFDVQFDKLKQGNAVLFGLKYKEKNIAFHYFEYRGSKANASSAADDPDYDKLPLYHILVFKGMEYLKSKGVRYVDMGQPSSPHSQKENYLDSKQLNISHFKKGFKGIYRNQYRGIKYYSPEIFKKDMAEMANNYKIN